MNTYIHMCIHTYIHIHFFLLFFSTHLSHRGLSCQSAIIPWVTPVFQHKVPHALIQGRQLDTYVFSLICHKMATASPSAGHTSSCLYVAGVQKQTDTASRGKHMHTNWACTNVEASSPHALKSSLCACLCTGEL